MPRKASFFYLSLILLTAGCASVESDQAREEDHAGKRANAENTANRAPPHTRQPQEVAVEANLPTIQPKVSSCDEGSLSLRELEVEVLRVANNEPTHIFQTLGIMGYSTLQVEGQSQGNNFANGISCDELPIVMLPMLPDARRLSVADKPSGGSYGNTGTANLSESDGKTFSGEVDHLFAFYHPEEVESVETLKRLVYERLDLPAQQIYIEAVILEISSERLKELGVSFNDIGSNILSMVHLTLLCRTPIISTRRLAILTPSISSNYLVMQRYLKKASTRESLRSWQMVLRKYFPSPVF